MLTFDSSSSILPTSAPGTVRQVTISQAITPVLVPGRVYTLTMYQGRASSTSTGSNPSIAIRFGTTTITVGPSCSGSTCSVKGQGGSVYQRIVDSHEPVPLVIRDEVAEAVGRGGNRSAAADVARLVV